VRLQGIFGFLSQLCSISNLDSDIFYCLEKASKPIEDALLPRGVFQADVKLNQGYKISHLFFDQPLKLSENDYGGLL
jgi:hypothetical protein